MGRYRVKSGKINREQEGIKRTLTAWAEFWESPDLYEKALKTTLIPDKYSVNVIQRK